MATLWNTGTPADVGDQIAQGPARFRELKVALQERLRQAGLYLPDNSTDADSGAQFVSPLGKVANEWDVFDKTTGGAPDLTRKLIALGQTTLDVHSAVTANFAGPLKQAGANVVTSASAKRVMIFESEQQIETTVSSSHFDQLTMSQTWWYVPQLNSGGAALTGTIKEFVITTGFKTLVVSSPAANLFGLERLYLGADWVSDKISPVSDPAGISLLASPLAMVDGDIAARFDTAASFAGAAFPTVTGGDLIRATGPVGLRPYSGRPAGNWARAHILIEFDWP